MSCDNNSPQEMSRDNNNKRKRFRMVVVEQKTGGISGLVCPVDEKERRMRVRDRLMHSGAPTFGSYDSKRGEG